MFIKNSLELWEIIIGDYEESIEHKSFTQPQKLISVLESMKHDDVVDDYVKNITNLILITRKRYEETKDENWWTVHFTLMTTLENIILLNNKKISS